MADLALLALGLASVSATVVPTPGASVAPTVGEDQAAGSKTTGSEKTGAEATRARLEKLPAGVVRVPDPATRTQCKARRLALGRELGDGLFFAAAGKEGEDRFRTDDDFYWLTGVSVPGAALLLEVREGTLFAERLYLPPYDRREEVWKGPRLSPGDKAAKRTGIADTRPTTVLRDELLSVLERVQRAGGGGEPFDTLVRDRDLKRMHTARLMRPLQSVKDASELRVLEALLDITQASIADAMLLSVPGAWEFTTEAAVEGGMRRRGAFGPAFPSICASGPNTCVLDYRANDRQLAAGDLLVLDVGAEMHQYACDLTRTFPISGTFTPRQREIYLTVWEASQRAAAELRPGIRLRDIHRVASGYLEESGFEPKHFPHAIGHGLGLRVHDFPWPEDTLEEGMVVTIEPGLYLPAEELGVRLEDAYVITNDGARLLSDALPSHPDEIEALIAELRSGRGR